MGIRTHYFCDWCKVDAPKHGEIPGGWDCETTSGGVRMHICWKCVAARKAAIEAARLAAAPSSGSAKDPNG